MSKRIAVSMIVVLLVGSATWGGILQGQGFAIGTDNMIHLTQGDQSGQSTQNLTIDMSQSSTGTGLAMISSHAYGTTGQGGTALGAFGLIGLGQSHVVSAGGLGGLVMPLVPSVGSGVLQLAKARLNAMVLTAN